MPNFKIKDVILENKYVPSLHNNQVIADELYKCIKAWNLKYHITSITTNNSKNMVLAFLVLNQKEKYKRIKHFSCTTHTLQLVIRKELAPAKMLFACTKSEAEELTSELPINPTTSIPESLIYLYKEYLQQC
ncbi:9035_t:CDS:2 [Scutellospora calospora]|uniref:9035_t:CDS:1 n=1 Tax=Scutellospora calospora TaxID=85575 RepID=A0ACA9MIT7_9GLOM|nr:9035_t:CDS:2 [Scutellospora calospora]